VGKVAKNWGLTCGGATYGRFSVVPSWFTFLIEARMNFGRGDAAADVGGFCSADFLDEFSSGGWHPRLHDVAAPRLW